MTSTDLTTTPKAATLPAKIEYAKAMAGSNLLPRQYQGNPANLLFALEYADALGVSPINAITSIHVIEGRPTASADLIAGLVRRAGHKLRITGDDTHAVAQLIRADDPDHTFEARWDVARAQKAGLTGKAVWRQYPAAMLRSRAITEVARMGASDALYGVIYTPEEIGAEVGVDGEPTEKPGPAPMPAATPEAPAEDVQDAEIVTDPEPLTERTRKQLFAELTKHGITDAARQRAGMSAILGRPIKSRSELTEDDARAVILDLKARPVPAPPAAEEPGFDGLDDAGWAGEGQ